ncbi:Serine/threonine-protein kinase GRIK2 [Camellia lanceoleosa]|uniref:Serine/threonine-protein kinase GRIK2 n=1 Tax=Camellia lanceoleosa TaxID=1840588 RepID=A0ACC0GDZ9_9ERIC|nr:Serine/threonine-protein kinase GRIK2 [Camellia lanceoleosa]
MREAFNMFRDGGDPEKLVAAFSRGWESEYFYASLYAGLYYESQIPIEIHLQVLGPSKVYKQVITKVINSTIAEYVEKNIVHGDIKPDNLLVTAGITVKIGDFNVSQVFEVLSFASTLI